MDTETYMNNVAEYAVRNLREKGLSTSQIQDLMKAPDFAEKCMRAYNEGFERFVTEHKDRIEEVVAESLWNSVNKKEN
jgi:DNA-binding transcriptional MerR regulator